MFQKWRSSQDYQWSIYFNPAVDFAVWVLEHDGLAVSPFDAHSAMLGNETLQEVGLTSEAWQTWFNAIISAVTSANTIHDFAISPLDFYPKTGAVREQLATYWQAYQSLLNSRHMAEYFLADQFTQSQRAYPRLWQALYRDTPDAPLQIIVTAYPAYVAYPASRDVLVLASGGKVILMDEWTAIAHRTYAVAP